MTINVFTAARCRLMFNGVAVGFGKNVSVQEEITYEPQKFLDSIEAVGHEPVDYNCSVSVGQAIAVGKTLEAESFAAKKGQTPAEHLANLLKLKEITILLEDSVGEQIVGQVIGARLSGKSISVAPGGSTMRDLSFVALRFIEASELP